MNNVTLSKTYTQLDRKGNDQSRLVITVEYNPDDRTVDCLEKIESYNVKENVYTDITHIMFEQFHDQTDKMLDLIDWTEVYAEYRNNIIESQNELA